MNQYLQQLNNLAAQNEGGGDPPGGQKLPSGIIVYPSKEGESWVYKDKDGKVYGKSLDQQTARAKAVHSDKRGSYSGNIDAPDVDESKVPKGFFVEKDRDEDSGNLAYKIRDSNGDVRGVVDSPEQVYSWSGGTEGIPQSGPEFEVTAPKPEWMVRQESSNPETNFNWNVTLDDPSSPTGRRVSKYNLPPTTESDIMDVFHPNEEDSGITVKGFNLDVPKMSPRAPQFQSGGQQPLQAGPDISGAVLQGAAQQSGGGIVSDPNATAGSAAVSPQGLGTENKGFPGERRSRGFGATWEAPGEAVEFTQEDFYPTPPPMVGQYDTGNEYVARSARMPMGALSKAAGALQNRQVELDQKRQAFQEELYKPVKTAAPYQQNFNTIVNKQREDFIQKVAQDLTGGNVNKAYREIFSNPRLRAQYRELNADLEALGQRGAATFEKVINYQNNAATNKIQSTPEQRQLANDIAMGLGGYSAADGTGGSFDKLIKDMNRWDQMEGRDQYFKNTVGPSIKDFFQKSSDWELTGDGRYRFLTTTSKKNWDSHIRQLAVDMAVWQGYGDGDLPDEKIQDNINYLTNMLGRQVDQDVKHIDTYSNISRGGGDGGGGDKATHEYAYQKINPQDADYENVRKAMKEVGFYLPEGTTTLDSVSFQEVTGGKGGVPKVIPIAGTSVIPLGAYRDGNGKLWLFAKEAKLTGVVDSGKGKDSKQPSPSLSGDNVATMISTGEVDINSLPTKLYPFDRYGDVVAKKFGITGEEVNRIINEKNPLDNKTKIPTYSQLKKVAPTLTQSDYDEMMKSEEGIKMAREAIKTS